MEKPFKSFVNFNETNAIGKHNSEIENANRRVGFIRGEVYEEEKRERIDEEIREVKMIFQVADYSEKISMDMINIEEAAEKTSRKALKKSKKT